MKKLLVKWSPAITVVMILLASIGYYLSSSLQLKLSLTDLLPKDHPAVVKFEKLTDVVGGVGYFTIILEAQDEVSHLQIAPDIITKLKDTPLVRSSFYHREQRFFIDRLLYYVDLPKLRDLEKGIRTEIKRAKREAFDIGLWDDAPKKESSEPIFNDELKRHAKKSADVSPYLISRDKKHLLVMVKPSFDSMDLKKTEDLMNYCTKILDEMLPKSVTYKFAERYYAKIVETKVIQNDIFILGGLSISLIALIIFLYLHSFRSLLIIFVPVLLGMGITFGITRLVIGHINIITGFLMGIVSGLGVDYGIHLLLRLRLEKKEPSGDDPDPVWRTLASSGHSVFVGAMAASVAFFLLCFSSFRAFSEFGFICGVGIISVFICLLTTFSALSRFFKLDVNPHRRGLIRFNRPFPILSNQKVFLGSLIVSVILGVLAYRVKFEYDFDKMLQLSKEIEARGNLVDAIYERSVTPSALSAPTKQIALDVEKLIKDKYMPSLVSDMISGASIVPDDQAEKEKVLADIDRELKPLDDDSIQEALDIPASVVRLWVKAKPFTFADLPSHIQDALRGTRQEGFLIYLYPAGKLSDATSVKNYAAMVRETEAKFPELLTGSDAVIFSDILNLINEDGRTILIAIFLSVGIFIWLNVRKWDDTLMSYLPLLISLPVGMGLMAIFGVKFNIFNISIIPTFIAMGIDVPIHLVHRARETGSGFKAARDLATSINLALLTAAVGFGVLVFARAGVLQSLGWIALLGTAAIWWIGLFVLPAFLEWYLGRKESSLTELEPSADSTH